MKGALTVALVVIACVWAYSNSSRPAPQPPDDHKKRLDELAANLAKTTGRLEGLIYDTTAHSWSKGAVILGIYNHGYSTLLNDCGMFYVSVDDAKPYGDGTRLTLGVGNPLSATFQGFTLNFSWWGKDADGGTKRITHDVTFTQALSSGSWTTVHVTVPAKMEDLRHFMLDVKTSQLSLSTLKARD